MVASSASSNFFTAKGLSSCTFVAHLTKFCVQSFSSAPNISTCIKPQWECAYQLTQCSFTALPSMLLSSAVAAVRSSSVISFDFFPLQVCTQHSSKTFSGRIWFESPNLRRFHSNALDDLLTLFVVEMGGQNSGNAHHKTVKRCSPSWGDC